MATPCIESTEGFYFGRTSNVANIQSVNAFIGEFDIQKRRIHELMRKEDTHLQLQIVACFGFGMVRFFF